MSIYKNGDKVLVDGHVHATVDEDQEDGTVAVVYEESGCVGDVKIERLSHVVTHITTRVVAPSLVDQYDEVFKDESGWHFTKEVDVLSGPYVDEAQARAALGEYMKSLYGDN